MDHFSNIIKNHYFSEADRFASYKFWPYVDTAKCNKKTMSEAGFYFSGNERDPDSATCFFCYKQLDNWEENDDPFKEHRKHSPQCAFIQLNRPESQLLVSENLELLNKFGLNKLREKNEALEWELNKKMDNARAFIIISKK